SSRVVRLNAGAAEPQRRLPFRVFARSACFAFLGSNQDLRFVQACAAALRTLAGLRQFVFTEREAALAAFRGLDDDPMSRRTRRADGVAQVIFHIAAVQSHLSRNR